MSALRKATSSNGLFIIRGRTLRGTLNSILFILVLATPCFGAEPDSTVVDSAAGRYLAKSAAKAMTRSLLLPGWGQFYNGKRFKGTLIAAAEVGSVVALFVRRDQINNESRPAGQAPKRNFFVLSTIGIVFYSVVDAFVDAHLDDFDWGQLSYGPGRNRKMYLRFHHSF